MPTTLPAVVKSAPLPVSYETARVALEACYEVDECKAWADKAIALASYARQCKDEDLINLAKRIHGRAIRRCGQLMKELEPKHGANTPPRNGAKGPEADRAGTRPIQVLTRKAAGEAAGLSDSQRKTAIRVANVPAEDFERQVESDDPPTVTKLAAQGTKAKPKPLIDLGDTDPEDFKAATKAIGTLRLFCQSVATCDLARAARGFLNAREKAAARQDIAAAHAWLDQLSLHLGA